MADTRPGYHRYTDTKKGQTFWCKCQIGKSHRIEPRFDASDSQSDGD